jgi:predicted dehydrogenase
MAMTLMCFGLLAPGCERTQMKTQTPPTVQFTVLDPGHFHAALVQKTMYPQVLPQVNVYAPEGPDVEDYLARIDGFNTRRDNPTNWRVRTHLGPDFLHRFLADTPGNVLVLSGNNAKKTDYILAAVEAGLNVLADKPMVIEPAKFPTLIEAFNRAHEKGLLVYDIMTERYEITTMLQRELSRIPDVFGQLHQGSPQQPAITKESVHHFYKQVAGKPIKRPAWFFDEAQRGEALVDVSTHLVDLVQWECFPEQRIDYRRDIEMIAARRWTTELTNEQFRKVTQLERMPNYLRKNAKGNLLQVYSSGEMIYRIKGVAAKVSVAWNFEAPPGTGDTHTSIMRGTRANLIIRQGADEQYRPTLYIEAHEGQAIESAVMRAVRTTLQGRYAGIALDYLAPGRWRVTIPERYKIGHEAHFGQVTQKYLQFLTEGDMPAWEVPNMIAKYYTTTLAMAMAKK